MRPIWIPLLEINLRSWTILIVMISRRQMVGMGTRLLLEMHS
jgi:hypothetical protein